MTAHSSGASTDAHHHPPRVPQGLLATIGRTCANHPWRIVGTWLATLILLIALVATVGGKLENKFNIPNSDAQRASDLLTAKFKQQSGDAAQIVFATTDGSKLDSGAPKATIDKALAAGLKVARNGEQVQQTGPFDAQHLAKSGDVAYAELQYSKTSFNLKASEVKLLMKTVRDSVAGSNVKVEFTGGVIDAANPVSQGSGEAIGLLVALVVLLVLFGTLTAALIPILMAILSVATGFLLLYLATNLTDFNTITPILLSMIGLGVGIDYSLFIVTRFRSALHEGLDKREAAAFAAATAGRAVIFAGVTVAISIIGLATIGLSFITKLGIGAALGVLTAVLMANTLLPAVLSLLGSKIDRLRVPGLKRRDDSLEASRRSLAGRWGRVVTGHPLPFLIVPLIIVATLIIPTTRTQLGLADSGTAPTSTTQRKAYDILAKGFGAGFNGPFLIAVDLHGDSTAGTKLVAEAKKTKGVAFVTPPIPNQAKDVDLIQITPASAPQSKASSDLVKRLRKETVPNALKGSPAKAYVGGGNAAFTDIGDRIIQRLPWFLLFVVGITFVVMAMAFRSFVVALKAGVTTLLSALVGFGVLVFVFQLGHGMGLLGLDRTGPIESFIPVIAFAILFGLAMDYEVFLMSRIREEHVHGKETVLAVQDGMAAIGKVIVAAALIMSSVFWAFAISPDRVSKEFAVVLGTAILVDALVVRMTMVPALLSLLGDRAWWMPKAVDRVLPRITIEPPTEHTEAGRASGAAAPAFRQ